MWKSSDFSTWKIYDYAQNILIDYGIVHNMNQDIISYPILITIVADPAVSQNTMVSCSLTLGQNSLNLDFYITTVASNVSKIEI